MRASVSSSRSGRRLHVRAGARVPAARHLLGRLAAQRGGRLAGRAERDQLRGFGHPHRRDPTAAPPCAATPPPREPPPIRRHGRVGVEPRADRPEQVERLDQRRHGALVGRQQDLRRARCRAAAPRSCRRRAAGSVCARRRGRGARLRPVRSATASRSSPSQPAKRSTASVQLSVAASGRNPPVGVGEARDQSGGVHGALAHRGVGRAGGAEADRRLAGAQPERQRRAHVVAGARPDQRALGQAQLGGAPARRRRRPSHRGRARRAAGRGPARSARAPRPRSPRRGSTTRPCPRRRRGR